jgi:GGDEF domain-containing protein
LKQLSRHEWWLWFSALTVTTLAAVAFVLSSFQSLFRHSDHFYEIRAEQASWGAMCLLLLFNGWLVYQHWAIRRVRKRLAESIGTPQASGAENGAQGALDAATGLYTREAVEQMLGKEIARARKGNSALTLATVHLDDFAELNQRHGLSASDQALKEFARRMKRACRGSDIAARLSTDDFLLVLPECGLNEVKLVLNRLGALEVNCGGRTVVLPYTTGWVDYQPGDLPGDLLKRATELLHLYDTAAKHSVATTLRPH